MAMLVRSCAAGARLWDTAQENVCPYPHLFVLLCSRRLLSLLCTMRSMYSQYITVGCVAQEIVCFIFFAISFLCFVSLLFLFCSLSSSLLSCSMRLLCSRYILATTPEVSLSFLSPHLVSPLLYFFALFYTMGSVYVACTRLARGVCFSQHFHLLFFPFFSSALRDTYSQHI